MVPRIVFDFDGVIHSYRSGWKGETVIPDPPVPGIREVIEQLMERGYDVVIVSARAKTAEGTLAICHWLQFHGLPMLSVMSPFMGVTSGLSQASGSWQIDEP